MLFTTDEETGSITSREIIESEAQKAALVLCMEPALANGALKTFRKGTGGFSVTTYGRAAHAGADHAKGIAVLTLRLADQPLLDGPHNGHPGIVDLHPNDLRHHDGLLVELTRHRPAFSGPGAFLPPGRAALGN